MQNEGLAHELASKFYRARGFDLFADASLREARACYLRWGADGKVRQIDQQHTRLFETPFAATISFTARAEQLDLLSVAKGAQTVSGEIVLDKLVRTLLHVVLEQGGAQKGCLLLSREGGLTIEAEATLDDNGVRTSVLQSLLVESSSPLVPASIVKYVQRTKEQVILHDAAAEAGKFSSDEYIARRKPRSVLCLPILRQAEVVGVLYLENDLVAGVFTPERLVALTLLATQAAISVENASLMAKAQAERAAAEEAKSRAALLAEAGPLLSESLDYEETLARFARLCVRSIADWCVAVPLVSRGRTLGVIILCSASAGRRYGRAELELAQELAHRAAIAVDNAELYREAQEAIRLRDEFLSVASHELYTPLTSLMLSLEAMLPTARTGQVLEPRAMHKLLDLVSRQGRRLIRLVGDLLDVSRIERGRLVLDLAEVELGSLVRDVVERLEPDLGRSRCSLSIRASAPVTGRWDRSRLDQVLTNLLSNAMKFGPGEPVEVSIAAKNGLARLAVTDRGIGISRARQAHVFQRFERAAPAEHYGGLGLGLYISRRIVEAHGGSIRVESEPGAGSTFTVDLPCAPPEVSSEGCWQEG